MLIVIGMVVLPLPIPSSPFVVGGLALLAPDYPWAERWMVKAKSLLTRKKPDEKEKPPRVVLAL